MEIFFHCRSIFNKTEHGSVKRIMDEDEFDNTTVKRKAKMENPTDILTEVCSHIVLVQGRDCREAASEILLFL